MNLLFILFLLPIANGMLLEMSLSNAHVTILPSSEFLTESTDIPIIFDNLMNTVSVEAHFEIHTRIRVYSPENVKLYLGIDKASTVTSDLHFEEFRYYSSPGETSQVHLAQIQSGVVYANAQLNLTLSEIGDHFYARIPKGSELDIPCHPSDCVVYYF